MKNKYKLWNKLNNCWSYDDVYLDADGDLYEITEVTHHYEVFMLKKDVTDSYELVWFVEHQDTNSFELYQGCICLVYLDHAKQDYYYMISDSEKLYYDMNRDEKSLRITDLTFIGDKFSNPELLANVKA